MACDFNTLQNFTPVFMPGLPGYLFQFGPKDSDNYFGGLMGFFVRPCKRHNYRVIEEIWTPKRQEKAVPRDGYSALGFHPNMTLDEAKSRASQINKQHQIEQKKIAATARRIAHKKLINEAYLPKPLVDAFEADLEETYLDNPSRLKNVQKHWLVVKEMISDLELDPKDFYDRRQKIYNYYKLKAWSPDYIKKLHRVLNMWGFLVGRKTNTSFTPVPRISILDIRKIQDKRAELTGIKRPAAPLSLIHLQNCKSKFEVDNLIELWNWMFVALVFGLRPVEMKDVLGKTKNVKIEQDPDTKKLSMKVYQTKLTSIEREKRWKRIPIVLPEQEQALVLIEKGALRQPLDKTLNRLLGEGMEKYSPRKGFTDLMLDRGFLFEDVSMMLGHQNIQITYAVYKDRQKVKGPKAS